MCECEYSVGICVMSNFKIYIINEKTYTYKNICCGADKYVNPTIDLGLNVCE